MTPKTSSVPRSSHRLLGPLALVAVLGAPAAAAGDWVCHLPADGLEQAARVEIRAAAADRTHRDHAQDWLPNQAGHCFASGGSSGETEAFELLICRDRPGRSLGTQVETSRTGRIRSRPMGCELAQRP